MKYKLTKVIFTSFIITAFNLMNIANATLMVEAGDTGDSLNTAQLLAGGTTQVSGVIDADSDVDLFAFNWAGGLLDLSVTQDNSALDTQVFLFDSLGFGLFHNDDAPFPNSIIQTTLAAGEYFVGISSFSNDPLSSGGAIFPTDWSGQLSPTGPGGASALTTWEYDGTSNGAYLLDISSTAPKDIPEPSTLAIFAFGMIALTSRRLKKHS